MWRSVHAERCWTCEKMRSGVVEYAGKLLMCKYSNLSALGYASFKLWMFSCGEGRVLEVKVTFSICTVRCCHHESLHTCLGKLKLIEVATGASVTASDHGYHGDLVIMHFKLWKISNCFSGLVKMSNFIIWASEVPLKVLRLLTWT